MAFFSVSGVRRTLAILICVVLMLGSFDSAQSLGGGDPEMDLDAAAPPPMHYNPAPPRMHHKPAPPPMEHKPAPPPMQHKPPPPPMEHKQHMRSPIAVQGVVYCKSCKFPGVNLTGSSPLPGAIVKLACSDGRVAEGKTDKSGYFFIQPRKVKNFGAPKCKVFLVSSPLQTCKRPTNINGGVTGAPLRFEKEVKGPKPLTICSTGPFAFGPSSSCPHFL